MTDVIIGLIGAVIGSAGAIIGVVIGAKMSEEVEEKGEYACLTFVSCRTVQKNG